MKWSSLHSRQSLNAKTDIHGLAWLWLVPLGSQSQMSWAREREGEDPAAGVPPPLTGSPRKLLGAGGAGLNEQGISSRGRGPFAVVVRGAAFAQDLTRRYPQPTRLRPAGQAVPAVPAVQPGRWGPSREASYVQNRVTAAKIGDHWLLLWPAPGAAAGPPSARTSPSRRAISSNCS